MGTKELNLRDEVETSFTGDELPEQRGALTPTIFPGIDNFQLPANLDQCWESKDIAVLDEAGNEVKDAGGNVKVTQHLFLKLTKESPLIVVGGPYDGLPASATFSTIPRNRARKNEDPVLVADLTYLLRVSLADKTVIAKRSEWIHAINKHAGRIIRLEHGLSAQCDPERVRYVFDEATGQSVEDPTGQHGCGMAAGPGKREGSRLYSQDFKTKDTEGRTVWTEHAVCKNCGAMLRGFFRVEKFLAPMASTQTVRQ